MLKPPGTKHLKLKCDELLSRFAFKFILCRYTTDLFPRDKVSDADLKVGRCRLTLSNPS